MSGQLEQWGQDTGTTTGLTYGYNGGTAFTPSTGAIAHVASGTIALTASTVNYVERTYAGAVQTNTTAFTPNLLAMAKVTTSAGAITAVEDWRPELGPPVLVPIVTGETGVVNYRYPVGDIRRYGAVGDNVVDDTVAIRNAIAAVTLAGRGHVFIPPGRFRVATATSGVALSVTAAANVTIGGVGPASEIVAALGSARLFTGGTVSNVVFESFTISGTFSLGITIGPGTGIVVRDCVISGGTVDDSLSPGSAGAILLSGVDDITLDGNHLFGNGTGGASTIGTDIQINGFGGKTDGLRILDNKCMSSASKYNALIFDSGNVTIEGNVFANALGTTPNTNSGYGVAVYQTGTNVGSCDRIDIVGNRIFNTSGTGIYVQSCMHVAVTGNEVDSTGLTQDDNTLAVGGISVLNSSYVAVAGNTVSNSTKDGIVFGVGSGSGSVAIAGNTVRSAAGHGINVRGAAPNCTVSGNSVSDTAHGIACETSLVGATICDNAVRSTRDNTHGIYLAEVYDSTVSGNVVELAGGYGIVIGAPGTGNTVSGNVAIDCGTSAPTGTYAGIYVTATHSILSGNRAGNKNTTDQAYGIITGTDCTVVNNNVANNRTAGMLLGVRNQQAGNLATTGSYSGAYEMPNSLKFTDNPTSVLQIDFGGSGSAASIGTRYSGADAVWASNARQTVGADLWTQNNAGTPSMLIRLEVPSGGMMVYYAAAGTSAANFATFWGAPISAFSTAGHLSIGGNQVVTVRQAAITAPTGGSTIDTQARTAINDIRTALQNHGLTA